MEEHLGARTIVETLVKAGYIAYYAGGWVRDFLLSHPSDDIDIATNAPPEKIQELFEKTIPVGIAFGILIVVVNGQEYEVATFRQDFDYQDGRRPGRIEFCTAEEDASRRDFTINGMFYDPLKKEILDFVDGQKDLKQKIIRAIGNPHERIREDRLRMIRAIRLACRFQFQIDKETEAAIRAHAGELFPSVAIERVVQELEKSHRTNKLRPTLLLLHDYQLLPSLFPTLKGVSLSELEKRLAPLHNYPHRAPLIAFLIELFPNISLDEQLKLCKSLKLSNADMQFAALLHHAKTLLKRSDLYEWAYFYAHPSSPIILPILAAHQPNPTTFEQEQEERIAKLREAIERIQNKDPIIKSEDLAKLGIPPSKEMGLLLKEAERLFINEGLDKNEILTWIKKKSSLRS
jgi:poly(A) polymerase